MADIFGARGTGTYNQFPGKLDEIGDTFKSGLRERSPVVHAIADYVSSFFPPERTDPGRTAVQRTSPQVDHFAQGQNQQSQKWNTTSFTALDQVQTLTENRQRDRNAPGLSPTVLIQQVRRQAEGMTETSLGGEIGRILQQAPRGSEVPEEISQAQKILSEGIQRHTRDAVLEARETAFNFLEEYTQAFFDAKYAGNQRMQ